ncbi:MAG: YjbH domain-containing protein, partial [Flavobacteriaceae bacterium]
MKKTQKRNKNRIHKKLFVLCVLFSMFASQGQSVVGTSGLIHVPSARMLEDKQFALGAAFIPTPYFYRYKRNFNNGLNTYVTFGILPFVEIMFRYTHELNVPVNMATKNFPDRMLGFRLRILNETKKL